MTFFSRLGLRTIDFSENAHGSPLPEVHVESKQPFTVAAKTKPFNSLEFKSMYHFVCEIFVATGDSWPQCTLTFDEDGDIIIKGFKCPDCVGKTCTHCQLDHLDDHECEECEKEHLDDHKCLPCTKDHLGDHVCVVCTKPHLDLQWSETIITLKESAGYTGRYYVNEKHNVLRFEVSTGQWFQSSFPNQPQLSVGKFYILL